jgi:hypothetical protein
MLVVNYMDFDTFLKDLGYTDNAEVRPDHGKDIMRIVYDIGDKQLSVCPFVIYFPNKKSYLYKEYNYSIYYDSMDVTKKKISNLIKNIKYPEPGRVGEVGWDVEFHCDPYSFTARERTQIVFQSFKLFKEFMHGTYTHYQPEVGDILSSQPFGPKFNLGFTDESKEKGIIQRSTVSKRFYFGDVKEDGMQYCVYGEDLTFHPI